MQKREFREAVYYLSQILEHCNDSMKHFALKIECLISQSPDDMTKAVQFTTALQERFIHDALFLFWRGRVLLYNGQVDMGKKHLKQALQVDPENKLITSFWKSLSKSERVKTEANDALKAYEVEKAIELYAQCLEFDALNVAFNQTILYNRACALSKIGQNEKAFEDLDSAIKINPDYVKAYFKKGDLKLAEEKFDEALHEYSKIKERAPQTPGLREKIRHAQVELKKSKRKNYYKILGVEKSADEK